MDAGKNNYAVKMVNNGQSNVMSQTQGVGNNNNMSQTQDVENNTITVQNADDLTLTVPVNSNVKIDAPDIQVIGINGQMNFITNGGNITILQSRLRVSSVSRATAVI